MNIYQNLINNASIGFGAVEKRLSRGFDDEIKPETSCG